MRRRKKTQCNRTIWCALVIAVLVAGAPAHSPVSVDERIARVERGLLPRAVPKGQVGKPWSIADRMAYHGIPGMSLAVIEGGRIAWARAYGVCESGGNRQVTPETRFQAASISKLVSAFGALLLVQQQRLELNGDVRQWLQSWKPSEPVTLRQLLSHTSGLNVSGFAGYAPGSPLPTVSQMLNGERPANNDPVRVASPPGMRVSYSGGGYLVVQQLVMDVTRLPFDEYMRRAVLSPLGMTESGFEQPLSAKSARQVASGHRRDGSKIQGNWMVYPELAPAGLWTTPTDLAQIIIESQDALAGRSTRALKTEMAREMLTARIDNAGLGAFLTGPNGSSRRFMHTGRNAGFDATLVAYKNGRQGAVVMINRNNNEGFITEVIESIAREYGWPDYVSAATQLEYEAVPSSIQASYAGVYETAGRPPLTVVFEDEKLFGRVGEDAWFRLYPASKTEFFATSDAARWTFVRDSDDKTVEVIARSGAIELRRRRAR